MIASPLGPPCSSGLMMLLKRLIHCIGGELLRVGDDMRIDVKRDRHRRMAQHFRDDLRIDATSYQERQRKHQLPQYLPQ